MTIVKANITRKKLEELAKEKFGRLGSYTIMEDGHKLYIYTALAKKNTPFEERAMGNTKHVHVATYVPYLKKGILLTHSKKYVKNLPKKK